MKKIKRAPGRTKFEVPEFPLGIVNLMLFGLVLAVVLVGEYMVAQMPVLTSQINEEARVEINLSTERNIDCKDYPEIVRKVLLMAENCHRYESAGFGDLDVFD